LLALGCNAGAQLGHPFHRTFDHRPNRQFLFVVDRASEIDDDVAGALVTRSAELL